VLTADMREWAERKWISIKRGRIILLSREKIRTIANRGWDDN
jgi:hypothetical protein